MLNKIKAGLVGLSKCSLIAFQLAFKYGIKTMIAEQPPIKNESGIRKLLAVGQMVPGILMSEPNNCKQTIMMTATPNDFANEILKPAVPLFINSLNLVFKSFMVIRFALQYTKCSVKLLGQKKPHHLVGECHF